MKRLIFIALLLTHFTSKGQVGNLVIHMDGVCDAWVEFFGSNGGCTITNSTGPIHLLGASGTSSILTPSNFTWKNSPDPTDFVYARVYSGDPNTSCGTSYIDVGETNCSYSSVGTIDLYDSNCDLCKRSDDMHWNTNSGLADFHVN